MLALFQRKSVRATVLMILAIILVITMVVSVVPVKAAGLDVYIGSYGDLQVNQMVSINEAALEPLHDRELYTYEEIEAMLSYLTEQSDGIDFTQAIDDVCVWQVETGADVAGALAILLTEGTYRNAHGKSYYNFFDFIAADGEPVYSLGRSSDWWNARKSHGTIGRALAAGMDKVNSCYWLRDQVSFYEMSFNLYGFPQNQAEADEAADYTMHNYCPWWNDPDFIKSGYDSDYLWCNRCAENEKKLLEECHRRVHTRANSYDVPQTYSMLLSASNSRTR